MDGISSMTQLKVGVLSLAQCWKVSTDFFPPRVARRCHSHPAFQDVLGTRPRFGPKNARRLTSSSRPYLAFSGSWESPRDPYIITICSKNLFKPGLEAYQAYPLRNVFEKLPKADSALMVAVQLHKTKHISTLVFLGQRNSTNPTNPQPPHHL